MDGAIPPPRFLEHKIVLYKDQPHGVLRDPEGLFEKEAILPPLPLVVLALLDGRRTLADVQQELKKHTGGVEVPLEILQQVIAELEKHFILESPRAQERRRQVVEGFRASTVRPAKFVEGGEREVAERLAQMFTAEGGAGAPDGARQDGALQGVIAPHIDFPRGGTCYTHAYRQVAESTGADIYVILGVAHHSAETPFVLTQKAYATAFGNAEADAPFTEALLKRAGKRCLEHEIAHLTEHSAEFQAVWLKYARREKGPFTVVPILCSFFDDPRAGEPHDFMEALAETIRGCGRSVCIVAGVDFAHVGPTFGDKVELDDALVKWMCEEDGKSLTAVVAGDADRFWGSVMADGNKRHVCGLTATYAALRLLGGRCGQLLKYGYAPDPSGGFVSFASAVFR
jgi:hypothetical protein